MRMANDGISFPDLEQYHIYHSIMEIYLPCQNPGSNYLCRFHQLLLAITTVASLPKTPIDQQETHLLRRVLSRSAWSSIKQFSGQLLIEELYAEMEDKHPEHVPHLAGMFSPHMLSPLVVMSHSMPGHRVCNWNFLSSMLRKLCLPVYDPNACP